MLDHQATNGMIGLAPNDDWWLRVVMLKVLKRSICPAEHTVGWNAMGMREV